MRAQRSPALADFAELIRRCREEAGYANAGQFHRAHGRELMGCTAKAYQNLERGLTVPSPALVERLATALRVGLREDRLREFSAAYLRVLLGPGRFCEYALSSLAGAGEAGAVGEHAAGAPRGKSLSAEESRLIHSSKEAYWSFALLCGEVSPRSPADLAGITGFKQTSVEKALRELAQARLIEHQGYGYVGAAALIEDTAGPEDRHHGDALTAEGESGVMLEHPLLIRASETDLRQYFAYLKRGMEPIRELSTRQQGPDTGLFAVELSLRKLFAF